MRQERPWLPSPLSHFLLPRGRLPFEKVKRLTLELEHAMREAYGVKVETLAFDAEGDMKPLVMVVAHTKNECALVRKSPCMWV
jgi:hypothetical protein